MERVEQVIKAYRDEMECCWMAGINVPAHVVMSRERLAMFVEHAIPFLVEQEIAILQRKLNAMQADRRRTYN